MSQGKCGADKKGLPVCYQATPIDWPYSSFHRHVKQGTYDSDWGASTEIKFDENVGHE